MPWEGKPKWTGERIDLGGIEGKLLPIVYDEPFAIQIEGSNDFFIMLFSDEEKLTEAMRHFLRKLGMPDLIYGIAKVKNTQLLEELKKLGFRLMFNPLVIDDHHTKWGEIIKKGEEWRYVDPETN
jgi:hypothetical protein